ncbi:hypothetical protein CCP1ISM_2050004 [Azospirillaceae bacterium]
MIPSAGVTLYTLMISKRLSDVMETLSDERLPMHLKLSLLTRVFTSSSREE